MSEIDPNIPELYTKFKAAKKQTAIADRIVNCFKENKTEQKSEKISYQITEALRNQPGRYPLDKIAFLTEPVGQTGFRYGFKHKLGKDTFNVDFWSYNEHGILVQEHKKDFPPEIEISKNEKGEITHLLHLPEGYQIPVGPIYFKEANRPMSQEELNASKTKTLENAKAAGIKVSKETIKIADEIADKMGSKRKFLPRYFYWQPLLEEEVPIRIGIDFEAIKPSEMGLKPEKTPVFHQKVVITEED